MIAITDIKVVEVPEDWMQISRYEFPDMIGFKDPVSEEDMIVETETIEGKRFKTPKGKTVCIGMAKDVQDILEIPFEAFSNMEYLVNKYHQENNVLRNSINRFRHMTFWKRLKFWLFPNKIWRE